MNNVLYWSCTVFLTLTRPVINIGIFPNLYYYLKWCVHDISPNANVLHFGRWRFLWFWSLIASKVRMINPVLHLSICLMQVSRRKSHYKSISLKFWKVKCCIILVIFSFFKFSLFKNNLLVTWKLQRYQYFDLFGILLLKWGTVKYKQLVVKTL